MIPFNYFDYASTDTQPGVSYGLMFAFNELYDASPRDRGLPNEMFGHASLWAALWNELGTRAVSRLGCTFGELANPFEPLAAIEAAGYATMEWIGASGASRGAIVLVAPSDARRDHPSTIAIGDEQPNFLDTFWTLSGNRLPESRGPTG